MLDDPFLVAILVAMMAFVLYVYFLLRRAVSDFRDGIEKGRR